MRPAVAPERTTKRPAGLLSIAAEAAPPSPANPAVPVPAKVVMTLVTASTRRMTLLSRSAM